MKQSTPQQAVPAAVASRRQFLKATGLAATGIAASGLLLPGQASARLLGSAGGEKKVSLYNIHTGESLRTVFYADGEYIPESLHAINHILRDYRTGQVLPIDPRLMYLLHNIDATLGSRQPVHVLSGYRSAHTNALLAREGHGVAKHSMHIVGRAIDIRVPGRSLRDLHRVALAQHVGGVGYYPRSDFVHVDTGRVRTWMGA